jgi:hypothetical protein
MAKQSFFLRLAQVLEHVEDPSKTATSLTAVAAKGATALTVASITGIINGATVLVGSGETAEWNKVNGAPSGNTVNLTWGLGRAHAIGERHIPGITYDFGDPTEDGVKITLDLNSQDVNLATKRTAFSILKDYASAAAEWAHPGWTLFQLASAIGTKQTRVTGAGTTASPYQLAVDGTQVGEDINRGIVAIGLLADGSSFFFELHGCDKDYTGFKATLKQGQLAAIPHKAVANSQIVCGTTAPAYTVDATKKGVKSKVFNLPQEFGIYSAAGGTPLSSSLTADATAGALSFTIGSSTNGAAADRVLLSSGDDSEIVIVDTVPDGTHVTTRNQTNYPHLTGTTIVEQQQVPFGGVTDDGLDLMLGGSTKEIALATSRIKGILPNTVTLSLAFQLGDMLLANIAYAAGAPQSDISGGRLALNTNIGTTDIPAAYFRGLNQGGGTIEINAFGITQEIKGIATALSGKDVAKVPITLRPCTLQFLQY